MIPNLRSTRSDHTREYEHQYCKVLMWEFEDEAGSWEKDGDDWWRWCTPVYRKPQASWALAEGFQRQKIWFAEKIIEAGTDPNGIDWPDWIQCYWDGQAGRWVVMQSPPSAAGSMILFQIEDDGSDSFPLPPEVSGSASAGGSGSDENGCESRNPTDSIMKRAKVLRRPCGVSKVFGEEDGYVYVVDDGGDFFKDRGDDEINGKKGFATLLAPEDESSAAGGDGGSGSGSASESSMAECEWVITWINFFREKQVLQDWYVSGTSIVEELINIHVWNDCRLDDEITEGVDCEDESGSASASGSGSD